MTRPPINVFASDWLALREPADATARSARLTRLLADRLARRQMVHALDLATGTGANMRYLAERLPARQSWLLADLDATLLERVPTAIQSWAEGRGLHVTRLAESLSLTNARLTCHVQTRLVDLAGSLEPEIFAGADLVTASALLDLVSPRWLQMLAERCREVGSAVLFALTYDGRIECSPKDSDDELVRTLVNLHQGTDKGFGDALGPAAAAAVERAFGDIGYHTQREPSDWVLGPEQRELQRRLIIGWADAATAIRPAQADTIRAWRSRRIDETDGGRLRLIVGHEDAVGWPSRSRA